MLWHLFQFHNKFVKIPYLLKLFWSTMHSWRRSVPSVRSNLTRSLGSKNPAADVANTVTEGNKEDEANGSKVKGFAEGEIDFTA